ncbi:MAG TPA: HAMP domain-containing protein, partial [Ilumatobacteraceae bacterium]
MLRGVRARVCIVAAVTVVVVLVVTALALLTAQRRLLVENLDDTLIAHATALAVAREPDDGELLAPPGDDDAIAQIVTLDGRVIAASEEFEDEPALPPPPDGDTSDIRTARVLDDEGAYRVVSIRAGDRVVHAAAPMDDIDESIATLRGTLLVAVPIVAALLAALTWVLVGRTLRPVDAIRREVDSISGTNLDRRVPVPTTGDEIHDLAMTMNSMLDRLERSAESQRRFVADASHELRTPLTRMRAELEVDRAHPETADLLATSDSILDETRHMQQLVEDL